MHFSYFVDMIGLQKHGWFEYAKATKITKEYKRPMVILAVGILTNIILLIRTRVWVGLGRSYLEAVDVEMIAYVAAHSADVNEQVDDVVELKN